MSIEDISKKISYPVNNDLISEYNNITQELDEIINKINILKFTTEAKLKKATDDNEKTSIFVDFKGKIDKIQQDDALKIKYKELTGKKQELEKIMSKQQTSNSTDSKKQQINSFEENYDQYKKSDIRTAPASSDIIFNDDTENKMDKIDDDLKVMINKYKKMINVPIQIFKGEKKITIKKNPKNNIKGNNKNTQTKRLYNLIESLKLEINK